MRHRLVIALALVSLASAAIVVGRTRPAAPRPVAAEDSIDRPADRSMEAAPPSSRRGRLENRRRILEGARAMLRDQREESKRNAPRLTSIGGHPSFQSPDYSFVAASDDLSFSPAGRPGVDLRLSLASVATPDRVLYDGTPVAFATLPPDELIAHKGEIRERLRPVREGVEQLFDIDQDPRGDLRFVIRVAGGLRGPDEPTTASSITFWQDQVAVASYSKVLVVDSRGATLPLLLEWVNGQISFTVPATWMASAAFPITVDPIIGTMILVTTSANYGPYHNNDIAYNLAADQYLTAYGHVAAGTTNDLFVNTINPTTGALGTEIPLIVDANETFMPALAWNPSNNRYLLVYAHNDPAVNVFEVRGLVLDSTGAIVGGGTPFTISVNAGPLFDDYAADVACDGTNWLVTWRQDEVDAVGTLIDTDLKLRIVNGTTTGAPGTFVTGVLDVAVTANFEIGPAVAFGAGGVYLVVFWDASANAALGGIFGRTVTTAGVLGALNEYDDPAVVGQIRETPDVTANLTNNEFLVGWDHYASVAPQNGDPLVRRVSSAGVGILTPLTIVADATTDVTHVTPVWNNVMNQYFVGWANDAAPVDTFFDMVGARLNGPDIAIIQNNIPIFAAQSQSAGHSNKPFSAVASRTGTTHVIMQWRKRPAPFEIQAMRFDMNTPPADPTALQQDQGATVVAPDPAGTVYVTLPRQEAFAVAAMTDTDPGQTVRLQVEHILNGAPYSGTFTAQGPLVASGTAGTLNITPIPNGQYKWRARVVDNLGGASNWVEFDAPAGFDHEFNVPNQIPPAPAIAQSGTTQGQFRMDGTTAIALGGVTPEGSVRLKGTIGADADGDNVRLEVEVQPAGSAFTGVATVTSAFGPAGNHEVTFTPVSSGAGYRWQAWTRDSSGAPIAISAAVDFGANGTASDFARDLAANTANAPTVLGQFEANGITPVAIGGTAAARTVILRANVSDAQGDTVAVEVEVKPIGTAFDGAGLLQGPFVVSGNTSQVTYSLPASLTAASCQWRARTIDSLGAVSAFVEFQLGGGVDFILPAIDPGGSRNNLGCPLSAAAMASPWLVGLVLAAALVALRRR